MTDEAAQPKKPRVTEHPDSYYEDIGGLRLFVQKVPELGELWRAQIDGVACDSPDLHAAIDLVLRQTLERIHHENTVLLARLARLEAVASKKDGGGEDARQRMVRLATTDYESPGARRISAFLCEKGCRYSAKAYDKCPEHGTPPVTRIEKTEYHIPLTTKFPAGLPADWETPGMKYYRLHKESTLPALRCPEKDLVNKWAPFLKGVKPDRHVPLAFACELEATIFNELGTELSSVKLARFMVEHKEWFLPMLRAGGHIDDVLKLEAAEPDEITEETAAESCGVGFWLKYCFPTIRWRLGVKDQD